MPTSAEFSVKQDIQEVTTYKLLEEREELIDGRQKLEMEGILIVCSGIERGSASPISFSSGSGSTSK